MVGIHTKSTSEYARGDTRRIRRKWNDCRCSPILRRGKIRQTVQAGLLTRSVPDAFPTRKPVACMSETFAGRQRLPGNLQQRELLPTFTTFPFNPILCGLTATGTHTSAKIGKKHVTPIHIMNIRPSTKWLYLQQKPKAI